MPELPPLCEAASLVVVGNGPGATANSTIDGIEASWDAATNSYLRIPGQAFGPASYTKI